MSSKLLFIKIPRARYSAMEDEELLQSFRKSAERAIIDEFFNRYAHLLYPLAYKYLKDSDSARDLVLEVFSGLAEKLERFDVQNFKSWLCTVTRNQCLMRLRKESHEIVTDQVEVFQAFSMEKQEDMHQEYEEEQVALRLVGLLTELKNDQKVCLEMMYLQQMSYQQISDATGFSMKQVKSYIQNGKRNLRNLFEERK